MKATHSVLLLCVCVLFPIGEGISACCVPLDPHRHSDFQVALPETAIACSTDSHREYLKCQHKRKSTLV